jgi:hypothetical protein
VLGTKPQQDLIDVVFFRNSVPVEFCVKVFSEGFVQPHKCFFGLSLADMQDEVIYFRCKPAGGGNDPFFVLLDEGFVNPGMNPV